MIFARVYGNLEGKVSWKVCTRKAKNLVVILLSIVFATNKWKFYQICTYSMLLCSCFNEHLENKLFSILNDCNIRNGLFEFALCRCTVHFGKAFISDD